jgi:thioredoxin-related protein
MNAMKKSLYKPAVFGCALLWLLAWDLQADMRVPVAEDLYQDGKQALVRQLPILLAFSAEDCSYCELLEEDFLQPMLLSGEYRDRVIIRKLMLDNGSYVADFSGRQTAASRLSDHYRVFVTPTILFVDGNGTELAERMVGINTPELFGGYLDACVETALAGIRNPAALATMNGCRLAQPATGTKLFSSATP